MCERTQGSETSQYLEEKKKMCRRHNIPLVAASETGTAQTEVFGLRGCKAETSFYEKSYKVHI
jgi:hypothetical protein